ncbi:hypothetical protein TSOC_007830 [Tetrabaena socialis]|uniref:WD repeat domain-containing protein n=1 Tax=Tetrabaena socialis TaxID=47790 RepID=A0A2J8A037_9CHLO|nr:hypothetical protein TSOC_007830 [Tetrabaena socialis]|eukprot:PNH05875.1 hypothetical protein TSOC_007830 [Tetrabaena socialis]
MNLVQTDLLREIAAEVSAQGGPAQFRAHALGNLELRTVLKESHCSPIHDIVFNELDVGHNNLFASVGKDQDVTCCAWVQVAGITPHELGDACVAVSGPEGVIQVVSVVEAAVVALLQGHRCEVVQLCGCRGVPGLLLSLGADGGMRLWDVSAAEGVGGGAACIAELQSDALAVVRRAAKRWWQAWDLSSDGTRILTGHRGGRLCQWPLQLSAHDAPPQPATSDSGASPAAPDDPSALPSRPAATSPPAPADLFAPSTRSPSSADPSASTSAPAARGPGGRRSPLVLRGGPPRPEPLQLPGQPVGDWVECVRCLPAGRVVAKSTDGRLGVWDVRRGLQLLSLRVPGSQAGGSGGGGDKGGARGPRCRFSVSRDGDFLAVGSASGDVYVYDMATGDRTAHHQTVTRLKGPVRAAAMSEDGRHLLAVRGNGYLFRYEYIHEPAGSDDEEDEDEDAADEAPEDAAALEAAADEGAAAGDEAGAASRGSSPAMADASHAAGVQGPRIGAGGGAVAMEFGEGLKRPGDDVPGEDGGDAEGRSVRPRAGAEVVGGGPARGPSPDADWLSGMEDEAC